jgi:small subunit ribosomal protein S16
MPTKIRLQRHGKKRFAFFHLVIADSRAPRDGKFIEKLGTYNPNTNPATIDIDFDKALDWVKKGAQPTDTVKALLSYKGIIYKNHLDKGVLKGAFSQEEADKKFEDWVAAKEAKINSKVEKLTATEQEEAKKRHAAEQEVNKKRADSIAAKVAELAGEVADAAAETVETVADAAETAVEATENAVEEVVENVKEATAKDAPVEAKAAPEETAAPEAKEEKKD